MHFDLGSHIGLKCNIYFVNSSFQSVTYFFMFKFKSEYDDSLLMYTVWPCKEQINEERISLVQSCSFPELYTM